MQEHQLSGRGLEISLSREIRDAVNSNVVLDAPREAVRLVRVNDEVRLLNAKTRVRWYRSSSR
jgi:hypothetical protein